VSSPPPCSAGVRRATAFTPQVLCVPSLRLLTVYGLSQREEVAFAIAEPHAAFACAFARVVALNIGYPIDDLEAGHVDLLEDDPAASQVRHHRPYVLDLEPHLGERAGSRSRREEDVELSGRAKVAQTPLALLDGR
jgi:hypothetical protein